MKITSLLIGVCLLSVLTGCHKPQPSEVIGAAETTIQNTALASITAKYPDVGSSELRFSDIMIRATPNGDMVDVTYELPASATTNTEGKRMTITVQTIGVEISPSGKVDLVYKGRHRGVVNAN